MLKKKVFWIFRKICQTNQVDGRKGPLEQYKNLGYSVQNRLPQKCVRTSTTAMSGLTSSKSTNPVNLLSINQ